jgi:hypothetical protein
MTDQDARKLRFQKELRASKALIDCMNRMITENEGKINTRDEVKENDLDQLVAAMYGKAGKTFMAILELSLLGYGEDALVLLRSNINLMINLAFILKENPVQRAGDFIAYSQLEQKKYVELHGEEKPDWFDRVSWHECEKRAEGWRQTSIRKRAEEAKESFHYETGYRFYSSIEHSDAWALSRYLEGKGSGTLHVTSAPSDQYVSLVLEHNFAVMATVLYKMCEHFLIEFSGYQVELDAGYELFHVD